MFCISVWVQFRQHQCLACSQLYSCLFHRWDDFIHKGWHTMLLLCPDIQFQKRTSHTCHDSMMCFFCAYLLQFTIVRSGCRMFIKCFALEPDLFWCPLLSKVMMDVTAHCTSLYTQPPFLAWCRIQGGAHCGTNNETCMLPRAGTCHWNPRINGAGMDAGSFRCKGDWRKKISSC